MAGAGQMEMFKAAAELRVQAPISERIADVSARLFIALTCVASGLIGMAAAMAIVGAAISFVTQSISITLR